MSNPKSPAKPETLSVPEAAQRLGVSVKTLHRAIGRGEIPVVRIGRRALVLRRPFDEMLFGAKKEVEKTD